MIVLSTAIAPELIMGLKGRFDCRSSSTMELKASPEGSMPTWLNTVSAPRTSKALHREITLEIDWIVKRILVSPTL